MRNNIFANMQESVNLKINNLKEEKPDNDGFVIKNINFFCLN